MKKAILVSLAPALGCCQPGPVSTGIARDHLHMLRCSIGQAMIDRTREQHWFDSTPLRPRCWTYDVPRPVRSISTVARPSRLFSHGAFWSVEKLNSGATELGSSRLLSVKLMLAPCTFR